MPKRCRADDLLSRVQLKKKPEALLLWSDPGLGRSEALWGFTSRRFDRWIKSNQWLDPDGKYFC